MVTSLKKKASASIDAANETVVPEDVPKAGRLKAPAMTAAEYVACGAASINRTLNHVGRLHTLATCRIFRDHLKVSASVAAALRLLMLTGCRRNEILTLRCDDVDLEAGELSLRDAKTRARAVALSPAAREVLSHLPRLPDNPWVITGQGAGTHLSNLNAPWLVVRKRAGLEDVKIHDLRRSFASRALALGESLTMICRDTGRCRRRRVTPTLPESRSRSQPPRSRRASRPTWRSPKTASPKRRSG